MGKGKNMNLRMQWFIFAGEGAVVSPDLSIFNAAFPANYDLKTPHRNNMNLRMQWLIFARKGLSVVPPNLSFLHAAFPANNDLKIANSVKIVNAGYCSYAANYNLKQRLRPDPRFTQSCGSVRFIHK